MTTGLSNSLKAGVTPYGDSALLIEVDDVAYAHRVASAIDLARRDGTAPVGVEDSVVGLANLVVHLDPLAAEPDTVEPWLSDLVRRCAGGNHPTDRTDATDGGTDTATRRVEIPVTFDGADLETVAAACGCTSAAVTRLLCDTELQVAFIGFAPGFPYLVGLPPELAAIGRRSTPRAAVPAGSVAVGGGFASVYPRSTPGGWMLLGRTTTRLFDPDRPPYALLSNGDTVRFSVRSGLGASTATDTATKSSTTTETTSPMAAHGDRFIEVLDPGLLSLVEDGGRRAVAGLGIPSAGPADPEAMRLANRLVGNLDDAAAIEVTTIGPSLRFAGDAHLAVVGSSPDAVEVRIDDHRVATDAVSPVGHGQVVTVGRLRSGLRAYVAVAGGIATPSVVGSRSTDMLSGLGHGPLVAGDRLDLGPPTRPHGQLAPSLDAARDGGTAVIRVIAGPHQAESGTDSPLVPGIWTVGNTSNRIGLRLSSDRRPAIRRDAGIASTGMVTGAIQLPPDGHPIVLLPDHATVGGYPVIACVIAADLPLLGQLGPGDTVGFAYVDRAGARRELLRRRRLEDGRVTGWFPTAAGT
jgi:KipI family sensor histidine kinase inhibitor